MIDVDGFSLTRVMKSTMYVSLCSDGSIKDQFNHLFYVLWSNK